MGARDAVNCQGDCGGQVRGCARQVVCCACRATKSQLASVEECKCATPPPLAFIGIGNLLVMGGVQLQQKLQLGKICLQRGAIMAGRG
jgi:hypothetical protein